MRCSGILALGALCTLAAPAAAAPEVVVSIKPLHALVAGVMAGVAEPELLLKSGASPHDYALRPSDAQLLSGAEVVISIGPIFETFLAKPLATLSPKARQIAAADLPGVSMLQARAGGLWEGHDHGHDHDHDHKHAHDHDHDHSKQKKSATSADGHIWLDPRNARAIVVALGKTLGDIDPENAGRYAANATELAGSLDALDREMLDLLAPVKDRPFIVFHDAYQYFETRYALRAVGSVTLTPDRAPGARRIKEIKDKIDAQGAVCLFAEPQFEPKVVNMLVGETGVRTGVLDPEGLTLAPGRDLYFTLIRGIGKGLADCLAPPK